jgi:hypothetical protein
MFKSPDQALAFAFRMRNSSVISLPSATYIAQKTDNQHTGDRLTQYDLHAQVGMIFSFLSRRPEMEQVYAFFLHGTMRERSLAASLIIKQNRKVLNGFGLDWRQLKRAVLGRSVRDVVAVSGLSQYKAWKFRRELASILAPLQNSLMDALYEYIEQSNTALEAH